MKVQLLGAAVMALALSACGSSGVFNRNAPDEFAIARQAPLVVPPDYNLTPPKPGAPRPLAADSQSQALEALFGTGERAPAPSPSEKNLLDRTGATGADPTARSTVGDTDTNVVNKGAFTRDILAAPAGGEGAAQVRIGG
ncbi:DUF3035 domain-containing protein [Sphingoaurantiacus capsulatus]|uniref:DUF3035 domain-containing protein n=1 Tax=Sphingoaurantiacus capsulatus TaxID=1771310 RepID=A0ABV7X9T8_9SPHN